jgi:hypothetical protein
VACVKVNAQGDIEVVTGEERMQDSPTQGGTNGIVCDAATAALLQRLHRPPRKGALVLPTRGLQKGAAPGPGPRVHGGL